MTDQISRMRMQNMKEKFASTLDMLRKDPHVNSPHDVETLENSMKKWIATEEGECS
jgi:hypothetical protein